MLAIEICSSLWGFISLIKILDPSLDGLLVAAVVIESIYTDESCKLALLVLLVGVVAAAKPANSMPMIATRANPIDIPFFMSVPLVIIIILVLTIKTFLKTFSISKLIIKKTNLSCRI